MLGHAYSRLGSLHDQSPTMSTVLRVMAAETMVPMKYDTLNIEVTSRYQKSRISHFEAILTGRAYLGMS